MEKEDVAKLLAAGPRFFANSENGPFSQRGFEIGRGWIDLVCEMARSIEAVLDTLAPEDQAKIYCVQCKEKFGELRIYYRGRNNMISNIVDRTTSISAVTCETCGNPGRIVSPLGRYMFATCQACLRSYFVSQIDSAQKYGEPAEEITRLEALASDWNVNFDLLANNNETED